MPTQRILTSGRNELGAYVLPDSFPGARRSLGGVHFTVDEANVGRNSIGAWIRDGAEAFITIPTDTGFLLAGARGRPRFRYRLYRSNIAGEKLDELPRVESATISLSNARDHTWELSLVVRDSEALDVFTDWVKAEVQLGDDDSPGGWQIFPMGHYRFSALRGTRRRIPDADEWNLTGQSAEAVLLRDSAYLGYLVPAESHVLATVRQILIDQGFAAERIVFPSGDVVLPTPIYFDAVQNTSAVRWLRICNTLLAAGGFVALYTDAEGRFLTEQIEDPAGKPTAVRYGSDLIKERHVIEDVPFEYDDARFANRIVVTSEDVNQTPPIIGVAENRDDNSRVSIQNYGVSQPEPIRYKTVASQEAADLIAQALLVAATGFDLKLSLSTIPDPRRGPREMYELTLYRDDGSLVFDGKWAVTGWQLPLSLGAMSHEVQRFESFAS